MSLPSGVKLGPYEVLAPLGAGGMGEVYRARDTRLDRAVAIKVLPAHLASSPDLRARFEREAKAVSSLNHPHICVLHDVGHQDGVDYLVLEYLEGESLQDRLEKGPLPLGQALRYATEIADALDKAHRSGVVHRDLKPGNVMLTKSGAKLLDFGLARTAKPVMSRDDDLSALATQAKPLTEKGTLLGTVQYMAPEQIEGREADARTDLWALGALIYEMVTGKRAFVGRSPASLIGAILKDEPRPLRELKPLTPPSLERLVKTCLAKDPEERWQNAHDLVAERRWLAEAGSAEVGAAEPARRRRRERLGWIVAGVLLLFLAAAVLAVFHGRRRPPETHVLRVSVMPPEGATVDSVSMSPDGRHVAFIGSRQDGPTQLWVRPLDAHAARALPGTEGAAWPFWSPDSQSLGFFAEGKLKKIAVSGSAPEALSDVASARGGTWSRDGSIVFAPNTGSGLYRISAAGGPLIPLTALDPGRESSHRWPYFLPDSRHVLYLVQSGLLETAGIYVLSVESKETKRLIGATSNVAYAAPGYLLFDRDGALMAQPFDASALQLTGDPFMVAPEVAYDGGSFRTDFAASDTGILAYRSVATTNTQTIWVDRTGKQLGVVGASDHAYNLGLSRDDQRLAESRLTSQRGQRDIWLYDLVHGTNSRFTFDPANELQPVWSPDGSRVAFSANREGAYNIYQKVTSGSGTEELLLRTNEPKLVTDWSLDGRYIAYEVEDPKTMLDLWVLPLGGQKPPVALLHTEASEGRGRFSPDVHWLAYTSNETGRYEVYVQPFPTTGAKWQVSTSGGFEPRWRKDGQELCYVSLDRKVMAAAVKALGSTIEVGPPTFLFAAQGLDVFTYRSPYAMTSDGQRFFLNVRVGETAPSPITLLVNWTAEPRK